MKSPALFHEYFWLRRQLLDPLMMQKASLVWTHERTLPRFSFHFLARALVRDCMMITSSAGRAAALAPENEESKSSKKGEKEKVFLVECSCQKL